MDRRAERLGARLRTLVVGVVAVDLLIVALVLFAAACQPLGWLPEAVDHDLHWVHGLAPLLPLLAAVLLAAVASLNGLRLRSEAGRLAERSNVLGGILAGRAAEPVDLAGRIDRARLDLDTDPGAWALEVLRLTEGTAKDCVREVAEWSVLYEKELLEP